MLCRLVKVRRGRCRELHFYARCENGDRVHFVVNDFAPYFYVPSVFGEAKAIDGETVARVEVKCPEDVREQREQYEKHYEADVPFARRVLIDTGIRDYFEYPGGRIVSYRQLAPVEKPSTSIRLKVMYIDIEVYSPVLPSFENPEHPVVSVTLSDGEVYETYMWHPSIKQPLFKAGKAIIRRCGEQEAVRWQIHAYPSEEDMLLELSSRLLTNRPDVVAGWNVGFDVEYLRARAERLNVDISFSDMLVVDMLEVYKQVGPRQRSYALKEVTVAEGIECREDIKLAMEMVSEWKDNPKATIAYNMRDVWRIVQLDRIHKLIDYVVSIKSVAGTEDISKRMSDGGYVPYSSVPIIDTLVLREARQLGLVLPSARGGSKQGYRGAIVLDPPGGLWEGVAVFDMSRYYPSLIISFNISPETKDRLVNPAERIWSFKQEPEGLLPRAVRKLLELREQLEKQLQQYQPGTKEYEDIENKIMAVKALTNSFYGAMANEHFRLFDEDVAATITGLAREGILFVVRKAEEMGFKPLYGDTDSVFIQVPFEQAEQVASQLTSSLRDYFKHKYGLKREPVLKLKFEKYYKRIFFKPRTKKRYAGLLVWKKGQPVNPPKLDVTGFEAVRTDVAPFTAYAQQRVFEAILMGRSKQEIVRLINELAREARDRPLSDIALYKGLSKPLDEYKSKTPPVRAAIYSNMYLGTNFTTGSKVRYVYVKRVKCKGLPPTDVVAFDADTEDRVAECFEIDWSKQLEAILYRPIDEILKPIGLSSPRMRVVHSFF